MWESILRIKLHLSSTINSDGLLVAALAPIRLSVPIPVRSDSAALVDLLGQNKSSPFLVLMLDKH